MRSIRITDRQLEDALNLYFRRKSQIEKDEFILLSSMGLNQIVATTVGEFVVIKEQKYAT